MSVMRLLSELTWDWGVRCFGIKHMAYTKVRAQRFAEESVELAQAFEVSHEEMMDIVHMVYKKPKGNVIQEIGGVIVTASVLCRLVNTPIEEAFEMEVRRCLSKSPEEFAKRNEEKNKMGFDGH